MVPGIVGGPAPEWPPPPLGRPPRADSELASALGVAPTAIYHHFPSRSAIVDAALGLVWTEASQEGYRLVEAGEGANEQLAANLDLLTTEFEALGLSGEETGRAFHTYGSFAIGSTLVLAARLNVGEAGGAATATADRPDGDTRGALEEMVGLSYSDPEQDEALFVDGLRRLIASFTQG
jgi:AcrR family transcriptional regulator